jgi:hypothetical protein
VKNQNREQFFETEGSTNGYLTQIAVGSSQPKESSSGATWGVGAPCPRPPVLPLLQQLLVIAHTPSQPVLHAINTESLGLSSPHPHTLHFHSLSLSLAPLAKYFPQSLSARKLYRKFLHSSPPSQAHGLLDFFSLT